MPTGVNVRKALEFLREATGRDTVIVFLASHGLSDQAGNYYFVPHDAVQQDVDAVSQGAGEAPSLVSWKVFFDSLRAAAGKRILIVDTCQARNISGTLDFYSLAKRSVSASFALMAASHGSEESQEFPRGHHGFFTYALIGGLFGEADKNGDGRVSQSEAFKFAFDYVRDHRPIKRLRQTPQLVVPNLLREIQLLQY